MHKKTTLWPEVFLSDTKTSSVVTRMVRSGKARKLGPKLYTCNMADAPDAIVSRNLWQIVALVAPGAIVSHRTAFENQKASDGSIFVTGQYDRKIELPGAVINQLAGCGPINGDMPYMGGIFLASRPRAYLENLMPSRRRNQVPKSVGRDGVERRLADLLRINGEAALNKLRDQARALSPILGLKSEFQTLDTLIAALLRSRTANLTAPIARAYARGEPYDPSRLPTFEALFAALRAQAWPVRPDRTAQTHAFYNVAFFDAYFSNYIEGTEFLVDEAINIVFEGRIPASRPADAHDILGTYRLVGDTTEMRRRPIEFAELPTLLRRRHATLMEGRPEVAPGEFKTQPNQAGATLFVAPELVVGTLRQGFEMYRALDEPFAQALFMMFLISEVHPFTDGNGRVARVMMNADLIAAGQTRTMVPTVYRSEYVSSLKLLTNHKSPDAFIRVMAQAQRFVASIDFSDLQSARATLAACNAFNEPADDVKLLIPTCP